MKITRKFLRSKKACPKSLGWFLEQGTQDPLELIDLAVADGKHSDIFWVFKFFLNKTEDVKFAIFCAELALPFFEEKYPQDNRPKEAISAGKKWLETGIDNGWPAALRGARSASYNADACGYNAALAAAMCVFRIDSRVIDAAHYTINADATVLPQIIDYIKQYVREKNYENN